MVILLVGATQAGLLHVNLSGMVADQISDAETFRTSMATGPGQRDSSIVFKYDLHTPKGFASMLGVGSTYLMLAPFIWQVRNFRQALALPDVFAWYVVLFGFVLPGIWVMARKRPSVALSISFYFVPLVLAYSISFANVGLAFRQRAQFLPFLFIYAAAGYDWRREKKALKQREAALEQLEEVLAASPAPAAAGGAEMAVPGN
jgi:hypothetical protein